VRGNVGDLVIVIATTKWVGCLQLKRVGERKVASLDMSTATCLARERVVLYEDFFSPPRIFTAQMFSSISGYHLADIASL
jgi:hypothetical protein